MDLTLYDPMEEKLLHWIREQEGVLDRIIADAAADFRTANDFDEFVFDARSSSNEMWNLASGKDLCYDRPTIGFIYSLWYHGKRVNTFLRYYLRLILQSLDQEKIELFDLGAGTGAVQWATGIVYAALKANNIKTPAFSVINIDSSPFMLQYNEHYLWKHFVREYPVCAEITSSYRINSWVNEGAAAGSNVWLTASYLFDHSENAAETAAAFDKLVDAFEPSRLLLLSSASKSVKVKEVAQTLCKSRYDDLSGKNIALGQVFAGPLKHVGQYRNSLQQEADYEFSGEPSWSMEGLYGVVLGKKQGVFFIKEREKMDLYVLLEKDRARILLTNEQEKAAANDKDKNRVIIVGPAGCGKSVVLTQLVKNIVEDHVSPYDPDLRMLVTTFNKDLARHLGDWIEQLLDKERCKRQQWFNGQKPEPYSRFIFEGSRKANISVYHIDILPTRIGKVQGCNFTKNGQDIETFHLALLEQVAEEYAKKHRLDPEKNAKILNPVFLFEEYHRIIYGWQCSKEAVYQERERIGRGNNPTLQYNSRRRRIIWDIICEYLAVLKKEGMANITMQRHRLLRKLSGDADLEKFDHILVDEIQDCTYADYTIFQQLLKPDGNLTLAGDLAQSIHLGTAVHFPTSGFKKIKLTGSFRLPFLISSAIIPLSQAINAEFKKRRASSETDIIYPYKGSPPGARPIVVFGKDSAQLALKIRDIFTKYRIFGFDQAAIFENDWDLANQLYELDVPCSVEIILKSKGLEKPCVIWSTRVGIDTHNDVLEFVYTILTRTTSVLIIAICESMNTKFVEAINYLTQNLEKIILWDQETVTEIQSLKQGTFAAADEEDADDSGEADLSSASPVSIEEI